MKSPRRNWFWSFFVGAFALVRVGFGGDFEAGNVAYEAGKFSEAVAAYERAIQAESGGANVYFNLGNAYYRAGEPGRAMLSYERALALQPRHPEASANLAFAQQVNHSRLEAIPVWLSAAERLGGDELALLACAAVWLAFAGLAFGLLRPARRQFGRLLACLGFLLALSAVSVLGALRGGAKNPERAVVTAAAGARALYAPAGNARLAAGLAAGSQLRVLQDRDAWVYVELPDGSRAWMTAESLERVVPR